MKQSKKASGLIPKPWLARDMNYALFGCEKKMRGKKMGRKKIERKENKKKSMFSFYIFGLREN